MDNKLYTNIFLNFSKNIIKGVFPYIFSNYTGQSTNTYEIQEVANNILVKKTTAVCTKTKKKLIYHITTQEEYDSLCYINYNTKNIVYNFKINYCNKPLRKEDRRYMYIKPNLTASYKDLKLKKYTSNTYTKLYKEKLFSK